jgi:hypothetical protein
MSNPFLSQLKFMQPNRTRTKVVGPSKNILVIRAMIKGENRQQNCFEVSFNYFFKSQDFRASKAAVAFDANKMIIVFDNAELPGYPISKAPNTCISNVELVEQIFKHFGVEINYEPGATNNLSLVFTGKIMDTMYLFEKIGIVNKTTINGSAVK